MVYCIQVQSMLQYGIIACGGAYNSILEPLSTLQKSIIKIEYRKIGISQQ